MYGYVLPDKPNLYVKDYTDFKAYYCGFCKNIGDHANPLMRLTVSYDMVFMSALMHNLMDVEPTYANENCILHPLKRRTVVKGDEVTDILVMVNAILVMLKAEDSRIDREKGRLVAPVCRGLYKRAQTRFSEFDGRARALYAKLREYENAKSPIPEQVADTFGEMMVEAGRCFGELDSDYMGVLNNLGKWVYLIDALDDLDSDIEKDRYNVFRYAYPDISSRKELVEKYGEDMDYLYGTLIRATRDHYDRIDTKYSEGIMTNTVYYGMRAMTQRIMWRNKQCKETRF